MGKRQGWSLTACVFLFLCLASQFHCTSQQNIKEKDLIQNLPGQPTVNFRQYGGYVAVNEKADRFLYYYFVEAINANDSTPLVIWFNGGPGCSSLQGALTSLGPFRTQSDGKTLYRNPYSWNNEANVLFLEMPMGVGFSYSNTPIDIVEQAAGGDKRAAEENYMFLVNWLERFPEYKKRELYITGQSYAGHYVPQLAQIILHRNNHTFINLRGILIGNPALDTSNLQSDTDDFLASHAFASQDPFSVKPYDQYNIYAPTCLNSTLTSKPKESTTVMEHEPCIKYYLAAYLNTKEVQEAMHANTTNEWESCNMDLNRNWDKKEEDASQLHILHELMSEGVRVWVYNGDVDSNIPVTHTMTVLKRMNLTVENEWVPWFSGGQLGGFTETYKGNFTFATVRGSGHVVPADQPMRALTLLTSFLRNTPLPDM